MNLQQLRFVRETVRQKFSLTRTADVLFTSQPGVSKAIAEFENELGFAVFQRHGKRLLGLTAPGAQVLKVVERILNEVDNLSRVGHDFAEEDAGKLTIATTHTQARYFLPKIVTEFRQRFPKVQVSLLQGTPRQIGDWVAQGQADIGVATEALTLFDALVTLPCYQWQHVVIAPKGHALLKHAGDLTLKHLARHPIVTYETQFAGRGRIDMAFSGEGIKPHIVLEAIDADVIKTYVTLGLGVGIIAGVAFDEQRDAPLQSIAAGNLFGTHTARLAVRRGTFLRGYTFTCLHMMTPDADLDQLKALVEGE
jgi:LysR family transcriptional regulator, cys regulon transcriptional activator